MKRFPNLAFAISVAVAAMVAAAWILWHSERSGPARTPGTSAASTPSVRPPGTGSRKESGREGASQTSGIGQQPADIESEMAKLGSLAWEDDEESLKKITAQLSDPEPAVRQAALAATRTYGSRDAIPALRAAAARSTDPAEQKELEETADYLEMPTLLESADLPDADDADDDYMGDE